MSLLLATAVHSAKQRIARAVQATVSATYHHIARPVPLPGAHAVPTAVFGSARQVQSSQHKDDCLFIEGL